MQTIDDVRENCRFVGKGIEKIVVGGKLRAAWEGNFSVSHCG